LNKNLMLIALSGAERSSFGKQDFGIQSQPQKVFSAIWALESEVNNGGFAQYFENDSAETASFVVKALEMVSAPKTADICRRAIECAFPEGLPSDSAAINAAVADFSSSTLHGLSELDQEFYRYPHDLTELLFAFVTLHPEEFGRFE